MLKKIDEEKYVFSDWRGQMYEALAGEPDKSTEAFGATRELIYSGPDRHYSHEVRSEQVKNSDPRRWFVYSGDEFFGSYLSPLEAEKVFNVKPKDVNANGLLAEGQH